MASGVKDLKVWQESIALAGDVVRAAKQSTRRETKDFTDRMMQSAVTVASSIAQGYASYAPEEQRSSYSEARRALLDLETRLNIARQAGLLQAALLVQLSGRLGTVSRLLAGYVAYLDRQAEHVALTIPALSLSHGLRPEPIDDREVAIRKE